MFRAQVIPLQLNRAQAAYMARAAGCARFAYNWALAEWKRQAMEWWESGKITPYPSVFSLQKKLNAIKGDQFPWLKEVSYRVPEAAIFAVGAAFEKFRAGEARYPRFKSSDSRRSFLSSGDRTESRIDGRRIILPRVGSVRIARAARWPDAPVVRVSISQRAGKWYAAAVFELPEREPLAKACEAAGVDLGIKTPVVVTAGDIALHLGADLSQKLNVERRKLKRANRRLHRRVKGSGRRQKAKLQAARIHHRMANIRADMQHKATALIASLASAVGIETLAVRNMLSNGRLARSIADVGFYEIKRQLKYKADAVIEADRFYPSSKTCSACGSVKRTLKLSDRIFICEDCGHTSDRDENAARNLERLAANHAVSARGARSPARKRKLTLSSLASKREASRLLV